MACYVAHYQAGTERGLHPHIWNGLPRILSTEELATIFWEVTTIVCSVRILVPQLWIIRFIWNYPNAILPKRT